MKKLLFVLAAAALMASCQSKGNKTEITSENMEDSIFMVNDSTLGELQTYTYEGMLPAADCEGVEYQLILQAVSPDSVGNYTLNTTYIGADKGKNKKFTEKGKTKVVQNTVEDQNTVIIQLVSNNGDEVINFLAENDSVLTMVGKDYKKPNSKMNYSIKKVK